MDDKVSEISNSSRSEVLIHEPKNETAVEAFTENILKLFNQGLESYRA